MLHLPPVSPLLLFHMCPHIIPSYHLLHCFQLETRLALLVKGLFVAFSANSSRMTCAKQHGGNKSVFAVQVSVPSPPSFSSLLFGLKVEWLFKDILECLLSSSFFFHDSVAFFPPLLIFRFLPPLGDFD